MSRIREYPRRCYPAAPFDHRIGIKRGFGDTGRAPFRLIELARARMLLGKEANGECRLKVASTVVRTMIAETMLPRRAPLGNPNVISSDLGESR
jgi:hypothetical protein